jgi:hypothetical protein
MQRCLNLELSHVVKTVVVFTVTKIIKIELTLKMANKSGRNMLEI